MYSEVMVSFGFCSGAALRTTEILVISLLHCNEMQFYRGGKKDTHYNWIMLGESCIFPSSFSFATSL